MRRYYTIYLLLLTSFYVHAQFTISTVGGNGVGGYAGDGSQATLAELNNPEGIAVDSLGNIFIADFLNSRIRKVNTSGIISTLTGDGNWSCSGDGGPASNAELNLPASVAVDVLGNIYIADESNNRIRKINTAGIISTIAGTGTLGFGGDGSAATNAELNKPTDVIVDATGNIYIADMGNARIRVINTNGIISSFAGTSTGFGGDGGPATLAKLDIPQGIYLDKFGNFFISDLNNNRIRKINSSGIISTIAGDGTKGYTGDGGAATNAELFYPSKVVTDNIGNLYIADNNNNCIRKVDTNGIINTIAGNGLPGYSGDGGPATNAELYYAWGLTVDHSGNLFVADNYNNRIRKLTPQPSGINGIFDQTYVCVYPNPNNGDFSITFQMPIYNSEIKVYDILGEEIYSTPVRTGTTEIKLNSINSGIYLYSVHSGNNLIATGKFIVHQ